MGIIRDGVYLRGFMLHSSLAKWRFDGQGFLLILCIENSFNYRLRTNFLLRILCSQMGSSIHGPDCNPTGFPLRCSQVNAVCCGQKMSVPNNRISAILSEFHMPMK